MCLGGRGRECDYNRSGIGECEDIGWLGSEWLHVSSISCIAIGRSSNIGDGEYYRYRLVRYDAALSQM